MATNRKALSKKKRFEVFKRDDFTCQYCGRKAPDVILEVDHIIPVSKNGTNNILNLITSCFDCNRGKGKRSLKKNDTLNAQRDQMEMINKKREQLEMLNDWYNELLEYENKQVKIFEDFFSKAMGNNIKINESGKNQLLMEIKKYGFNELIECLNISIKQYSEIYDAETIFNYTFRIANVRFKNKRE